MLERRLYRALDWPLVATLALLTGKSMEARNYTRGAANLATDHPA